MPEPDAKAAQRAPTEIADEARYRYETDAEFRAMVYRAAQIARSAENHLGDLFSLDSALLGAAVLLLTVGSAERCPGCGNVLGGDNLCMTSACERET